VSTSLVLTQKTDLQTIEQQTLDRNPAAVYLAGLGASSRRVMLNALDTMADMLANGTHALTFPWHQIRFQHVQALRSKLAELYKPNTANRYLAAIRGVLKAAWRLGLMTSDEYRQAVDVKAIRGETLPAGRSIATGELHALMTTCANDQTSSGIRDAALIAIAYSCGLRRAELVGLDLADYDPDAGTLRVFGKGSKERTAYCVNGCKTALLDWLTIRGEEPGALFWAIRRGGHIQTGQRLTTQAVYTILQSRANQAGVKTLSPHDMRRTFVGDLLDAGADIATVQKMAGHANVTTTARYDRRPEEAKRRAAELLHVPYHKRTL